MFVTRGLLEGLLAMAADSEPEPFEAGLGTTRAGEFTDEINPESTVFTHFYFPSAGDAVSAVFGFELGTGPGQTDGRFIGRPDGEFGVKTTDELHERLLIAIPPWDESSVGAFDRAGKRLPLEIIEAEPPHIELSVDT